MRSPRKLDSVAAKPGLNLNKELCHVSRSVAWGADSRRSDPSRFGNSRVQLRRSAGVALISAAAAAGR